MSQLFVIGYVFPLKNLLFMLYFSALVALKYTPYEKFPLALLPRLMIIIYVIPFTILYGYFYDDNYLWVSNISRMYSAINDHLVRQMITIGYIGLLGLYSGIYLGATIWSACKIDKNIQVSGQRSARCLPIIAYVFVLLLALGLTWISAPPETILVAAYSSGQTQSVAGSINFPAASLLSYGLLLVLLLDIERDQNSRTRSKKIVLWLVIFTTIIVIFQILRGDRDSASLVAAAIMIYLTPPVLRWRPKEYKHVYESRVKRVIIPLSAVVLLFVALGGIRHSLADYEGSRINPVEAIRLGFMNTTWSAVLWTNLGLSEMYYSGDLEYKYGETYGEYVLSLIPGFIASAIGYERPLEAWRGPAWELGSYFPTGGGIHAAVVPFWNFGIYGTFLILLFYGFIIGRAELASYRYTFWSRLIWSGFLLSSFRWFWYGDMVFIRSIMVVIAAGFMYQVLVYLSMKYIHPRREGPAEVA